MSQLLLETLTPSWEFMFIVGSSQFFNEINLISCSFLPSMIFLKGLISCETQVQPTPFIADTLRSASY